MKKQRLLLSNIMVLALALLACGPGDESGGKRARGRQAGPSTSENEMAHSVASTPTSAPADPGATSATRVHPGTEDGSSATTPSPARPQGAPVPASDWCSTHRIPESACTKCNPSLSAGFKARGDWCEEHGFPESLCPLCHPELANRPGQAASGDDAPADGTKVVFKTLETARLAGLRTVEAAGGRAGSTLVVTAKIVYDASRLARVNARSAGVVQAVRVDVGSPVRPGAPLAVIESAGVGADQSRLRAARSRVQVAGANHARVSRLRDEGIVPETDFLAAQRELDEAQADLDAAVSALGMVGGTKGDASRYTLASPIAGVVSSRNVSVGRMVDTEEILFEVVDTSTMWAEVDLPETAVSRVATGQRVTLTVEGLDGRELAGTLSSIAPEIDPRTRTAKGRIRLANPDGALRANMFARARIATGGARTAVMVPRDALQRAHGVEIVFVRLAEQVYEARRVAAGPMDGDLVEVVGRISPGDRVVTDGSFLLKTETLKESIGAGCCDVEKAR
jgi:cobalt-zinc-cadmium efflux system membrane fusion protein